MDKEKIYIDLHLIRKMLRPIINSDSLSMNQKDNLDMAYSHVTSTINRMEYNFLNEKKGKDGN